MTVQATGGFRARKSTAGSGQAAVIDLTRQCSRRSIDTEPHTVRNDQPSTERVFIIVDGWSSASGDFTIQWMVRDHSCDTATNLATVASPLDSSTVGQHNDFTPPSPCDGDDSTVTSQAPEKMFVVSVPPNFVFWARQKINNFDSIQVTRW